MSSAFEASIAAMAAAGCDSALVQQLRETVARLGQLEAAMRPWAAEAQAIAAKLAPMGQEATAIIASLEPLISATWQTTKRPKLQ